MGNCELDDRESDDDELDGREIRLEDLLELEASERLDRIDDSLDELLDDLVDELDDVLLELFLFNRSYDGEIITAISASLRMY